MSEHDHPWLLNKVLAGWKGAFPFPGPLLVQITTCPCTTVILVLSVQQSFWFVIISYFPLSHFRLPFHVFSRRNLPPLGGGLKSPDNCMQLHGGLQPISCLKNLKNVRSLRRLTIALVIYSEMLLLNVIPLIVAVAAVAAGLICLNLMQRIKRYPMVPYLIPHHPISMGRSPCQYDLPLQDALALRMRSGMAALHKQTPSATWEIPTSLSMERCPKSDVQFVRSAPPTWLFLGIDSEALQARAAWFCIIYSTGLGLHAALAKRRSQ